MPAYRLLTSAAAERALARLPEFAAAAVVEFMTGALVDNPRRVGKDLHSELEGWLVARRGSYRIVYRVDEDDHAVIVARIDHRADVYRSR